MILFVGQVRRDRCEREAFQEVDYRRSSADSPNGRREIDDAARIPGDRRAGLHAVALAGRPGPVVIALPEDMLSEEIAAPAAERRSRELRGGARDDAMKRLRSCSNSAEQPLLVLGGRAGPIKACADLTRFAEMNGLPVTCGFRRQDLFDNRHPNYVGEFALGINPKLKARWREADLIVAVGTRLGEIVTDRLHLLDAPVPGPQLVHVMPEASELGRVYQPTLAITADANAFAEAAAELSLEPKWEDWREAPAPITKLAAARRLGRPGRHGRDRRLARRHAYLTTRSSPTARATTRSGSTASSATGSAAPSWRRPAGAMGYGLPAAIAASVRHPERPVVCFAGDGCFLMHRPSSRRPSVTGCR